MDFLLQAFLSDMVRHVLVIVGGSAIPLIVAMIINAARLRGLNHHNIDEWLGDICNDTIKVEIQSKISELLNLHSQNQPGFVMPSLQRLPEIANHIHQDSDATQEAAFADRAPGGLNTTA